MQLVIGGFGFVGSNTVEALLDLDESCVISQYKRDRVPQFLKDRLGKQVFIEPADAGDIDALRAIGKKHKITGIVHLATGGMPAGRSDALELAEDIHSTVRSIANVIQVAHEWVVKRVTLSSAPVVYNGISELPWREDQLLQMTAIFPMEAANLLVGAPRFELSTSRTRTVRSNSA